ncbi:MAG: long-chain fatty acid--CoA ligase [Verrucomicrobia bacterium]|nr:long-chain fatty acid--CoA ligase [Verrucomicrobiota bacterium]
MEKTKTIAELLRFIEKHYHKDKAIADKGPQGWVHLSHQQMLGEIKAMALYLHSIGVKKGDMVGIMAISGVRWVIADLAIMACGAITVPLFGNISNENFLFECDQTNLKIIFVRGEQPWKMYGQHRDRFKKVIALDAPPPEEKATIYENAIREGLDLYNKNPQLFDELLDQQNEDDLATIVYTSSSTGIPKGVMLTHKNILFSGVYNVLNLNENDRSLSLLPLAHIFQRIVTLVFLRWNVSIYFFTDPLKVDVALKEVKPTFTTFVPRMVEKVYANIMLNLAKEDFLKRTIAQWAFNLALDPDFEHHLFHSLADKIVYHKVREAFGGEIKAIGCGSASLNPSLVLFFNHLGLPIIEGYGMTEMMVISINTLEKTKIGSVGVPAPGVEVKISPEGEILIRADGVMQGYYKNPEATAKALKNGWLHTGDKGTIDENGFLTIVGRTNEIVKTSTGEWIALVPLEKELAKAPFVEYAMVIAEHQKFVSALIFPNFEVVHALKISQNLSHISDEEYLKGDYIKREMDKLIETINAHHNHWEQIHAYAFILTPPTIEGGEITPTFKLRRQNIIHKYEDVIKGMYPEDPSKKVKEA